MIISTVNVYESPLPFFLQSNRELQAKYTNMQLQHDNVEKVFLDLEQQLAQEKRRNRKLRRKKSVTEPADPPTPAHSRSGVSTPREDQPQASFGSSEEADLAGVGASEESPQQVGRTFRGPQDVRQAPQETGDFRRVVEPRAAHSGYFGSTGAREEQRPTNRPPTFDQSHKRFAASQPQTYGAKDQNETKPAILETPSGDHFHGTAAWQSPNRVQRIPLEGQDLDRSSEFSAPPETPTYKEKVKMYSFEKERQGEETIMPPSVPAREAQKRTPEKSSWQRGLIQDIVKRTGEGPVSRQTTQDAPDETWY
jgi:hypothetical protein